MENFALTSPNGFPFTVVSPSPARSGKVPLSRRDVSRGKRQSRLTRGPRGSARGGRKERAAELNPLLYPNLENKRAVSARDDIFVVPETKDRRGEVVPATRDSTRSSYTNPSRRFERGTYPFFSPFILYRVSREKSHRTVMWITRDIVSRPSILGHFGRHRDLPGVTQ